MKRSSTSFPTQRHVKAQRLLFENDPASLMDSDCKNDKEFMLEAVAQSASSLRFASETLRDDKDFSIAAIARNRLALCYVSVKFRNNKDVVLAAVAKYGTDQLQYASEALQKDKGFILAAVKASRDECRLEHLLQSLQTDRDVVLGIAAHCALQYQYIFDDGLRPSLEHLTDTLRNDKEVVMAIVSLRGDELQHASEALRNDSDVVFASISEDGNVLRYATTAIQNDKNVVLSAVSRNGKALCHASATLRADKSVVLRAVSKDGEALQFAPNSLQDEKYVALVAVSSNGMALEYASARLQNDKSVVLTAVSKNGLALEYASEEMQNDADVVQVAVASNGSVIRYASQEVRNDRAVVLAAISQDPVALQWASDELRSCRDIVLAAAIRDHTVVQFASPDLLGCSDRESRDFIETIFRADPTDKTPQEIAHMVQTYFVGLSVHLSLLVQKLRSSWMFSTAGISPPGTVALMWKARLRQTQRRLEHVGRREILAESMEMSIGEYAGLWRETEAANMLEQYAGIISALQTNHSRDSWWLMLISIVEYEEDNLSISDYFGLGSL